MTEDSSIIIPTCSIHLAEEISSSPLQRNAEIMTHLTCIWDLFPWKSLQIDLTAACMLFYLVRNKKDLKSIQTR